jgi:hypothetical protein
MLTLGVEKNHIAEDSKGFLQFVPGNTGSIRDDDSDKLTRTVISGLKRFEFET